MRLCTMPGCEKPLRCVGLCKAHYARKLAYGAPDADSPKNRRAGTGSIRSSGYVRMMIDRVSKDLHVWIAERALGKALPERAEVHHVDSNPTNNDPSNLVICQDAGYHDLLHQRTNALNAGVPAHWRKCYICKQYGDPNLMFITKTNCHHRPCVNAYYRERRAAR